MKRRTMECTALILALLLSLLSVSAFAATADEDKASLKMENIIINEFDSIFYNDGDTVINNFGTVYNNGGTVYNNGGTVYNNEGIVYNNGGIVYNNGAQVYNNGGTVHNNGGTVYESCPADRADAAEEAATAAVWALDVPEQAANESAAQEESPLPGENTAVEMPAEDSAAPEAADDGAQEASLPDEEKKSEDDGRLYTINLTGDYSKLAEIEGLVERADGTFALGADGRAVIRAKAGLVLTDAITTAGRCTMGSNGEVVLSDVNRDGRLTLKFKLEPPVANLKPGSYGDDQRLSLTSSAEGARLLYTLDGSSPFEKGVEYKKSLELERSVVVKAVLEMEGAVRSDVVELVYLFPELVEPEFKAVREGYKSVEAKPVTLINTGLGTVKVLGVELKGVHKDCFVLNTAKGGIIPSGQKDSKTWTIAPADGLKAGKYEAEIVFTLDSGSKLNEDVSITVKR